MLMESELEKIRLHIGMYTGYQWIEKDRRGNLVGCRRKQDRARPLPKFSQGIKTALTAFQYLSSPLLHDINRMTMLLDIWGERLPPALYGELRDRLVAMEKWIREHEGKP